MSKNIFNLRNVIAVAICLTVTAMFSGCDNVEPPDNKCFDCGCYIASITPPAPFDFTSIVFRNNFAGGTYKIDKSGSNLRRIDVPGGGEPIRSNCGTRMVLTYSSFDTHINEDNSISFINHQQRIYLVNTDGTNPVIIDRRDGIPGFFAGADWSPDGTKIVYVTSDYRGADLVLYDVLTQTRKVLVNKPHISAPIFTPNGKQIVYGASTGTFIIDINGQNNQLFTKVSGLPVWSPQGNKIAFVMTTGKYGSPQIFVANACGCNPRQLTHTESPHLIGNPRPPSQTFRQGNSNPQWTPDGRRIVYVSQENGSSEIFIMNADGRNQRRLTRAVEEFRGDRLPAVTPCGRYILFTSRRVYSNYVTDWIVKITLDGRNERVLSRTGIFPIAVNTK